MKFQPSLKPFTQTHVRQCQKVIDRIKISKYNPAVNGKIYQSYDRMQFDAVAPKLCKAYTHKPHAN